MSFGSRFFLSTFFLKRKIGVREMKETKENKIPRMSVICISWFTLNQSLSIKARQECVLLSSYLN